MQMTTLNEDLADLAKEDFEQFKRVGEALLTTVAKLGEKGSVDFDAPVDGNGVPVIKPSNRSLMKDCLEKLAVHVPGLKSVPESIAEWRALQKSQVTNAEIAARLKEVAALRLRQGDKRSHAAHLKAAGLVFASKSPITSGAEAQKIKGIGPNIGAKIDEIIKTRTLEILNQRSEVDIVLDNFQKIWGVGLETARYWYSLDCRTLDDIRRLDENDTISLTKAQRLGSDHFDDFNSEMPRSEMERIAEVVRRAIRGYDGGSNGPSGNAIRGPNGFFEREWIVTLVGSYRRGKLQSKDVDLMCHPNDKLPIRGACAALVKNLTRAWGENVEIPSHGEHQMLGAIRVDKKWRRFDVFIHPIDEVACSLLAHTGPAEYNKRMRAAAMEKGWLLNEKHLYDEHQKVIPTATEADVQRILGFEVLNPRERK